MGYGLILKGYRANEHDLRVCAVIRRIALRNCLPRDVGHVSEISI